MGPFILPPYYQYENKLSGGAQDAIMGMCMLKFLEDSRGIEETDDEQKKKSEICHAIAGHLRKSESSAARECAETMLLLLKK